MNLTDPTRSEQLRVGLHHVCFRARERADVDAVHDFLADPIGVLKKYRIVPGKGLLA
jgi:hypothetical protein